MSLSRRLNTLGFSLTIPINYHNLHVLFKHLMKSQLMIRTSEIINETLHKTYNLNLNIQQNKLLVDVLMAQCLSTKNITNTALFVVKNLQSSYVYKDDNFYLKEDLHENQIEVLSFVNTFIPSFNETRAFFKTKKLAKNKEVKQIKEKQIFKQFNSCIDRNTYYQIMDKTFLQFIIEIYSKKQAKINKIKFSDYEMCSSVMRQHAIHGLIDNYQNFFKASKDFSHNPQKYKAKPKSPQYLAKKKGQTLEIPGSALIVSGKLVRIKSDMELFTDYEKKSKVSTAQLKSYQEFSFNDLLDKVRVKYKIAQTEQPVLMRIIPKGKRIKIEVVFNKKVEINSSSILGQMIGLCKEQKLYKEKTKNILEVKSLTGTFIEKLLKFSNINRIRMAGIDLGVTNIAGIVYSTDKFIKGKIISGKDYERMITKHDRKIDSFKKNLSNNALNPVFEKITKSKIQKELLKIKLIEAQENNKCLSPENWKILKQEIIASLPIERLNKSEVALLRLYQKTIYEHDKYQNMVENKYNFVQDFLHKLSHSIVNDLKNNQIEVVVVGKNDNWKQNSNMGKLMNRRFHNIPHARLIQMLRYKCYEAGILLLTIEESYTSMTSFINNSTLKEYNQEVNDSSNNEKNLTQKQQYGGLRSKKNRHIFRNTPSDLKNSSIGQRTDKDKKNSGLKIHSEMNGGYNIMRKLDERLVYDRTRHSRKCDIYTVFGTKNGLMQIQPKVYKPEIAPRAIV